MSDHFPAFVFLKKESKTKHARERITMINQKMAKLFDILVVVLELEHFQENTDDNLIYERLVGALATGLQACSKTLGALPQAQKKWSI